jgi:hypothetical protein
MNAKTRLHLLEQFKAKARDIIAILESALFDTSLAEITPSLIGLTKTLHEAMPSKSRDFAVTHEVLNVGDIDEDVVFFTSWNPISDCHETTTWSLNRREPRQDQKTIKSHIILTLRRWIENPDMLSAIELHPKYDADKQKALEYWNSSSTVEWADVAEQTSKSLGYHRGESENIKKLISRYAKATKQFIREGDTGQKVKRDRDR